MCFYSVCSKYFLSDGLVISIFIRWHRLMVKLLCKNTTLLRLFEMILIYYCVAPPPNGYWDSPDLGGLGTRKNYKYLNINSFCHALGEQKSLTLPIFHSFTGCDTTSAFFGKGKKVAWEAWNSYPEVTRAFYVHGIKSLRNIGQ